MRIKHLIALMAIAILPTTQTLSAGVNENAAAKAMNAAVPSNFNFGDIKVSKVTINTKHKSVTVA
ncbi:MAG: hypothetical protein K2L80_01180, partial [Muribaculaceae bacterium]|nr:hypothetical protein [Muribaculaceae bacterium]